LVIMTFNIKNAYSLFNWKKKIESAIALINDINPDVIGTQELTKKAKRYIEKKLIQYEVLGDSRKSFFISNEYNCILVKKKLLGNNYKSKTYALSNNINKLGTKFKSDLFPRICTTIHINYGNKKYLFINTHLDNALEINRIKQLKKINEIITLEKKGDESIIVTGDFNMTLRSDLRLFKEHNNLECTNGLGSTLISFPKRKQIDYIFVSDDIKFVDYKKITKKYNGIYASDHYPVVLEIK